MTVEMIMDRLGCTEQYAQKLLSFCDTELDLIRLVAQKAHERSTRQPVEEIK